MADPSVEAVDPKAIVTVAAPISMVAAAPAKLIVVAVVLTSANVVDGVVMPVVTAMPTANGTDDVAVCEPSFSKHVDRAVANSDHVEVAADELIVVPVDGVGAKELLVNVKVPEEKLMAMPSS